MNFRIHVLALASGLAAFLLVGGVVTVVAEQWIEFSLLVGIPAGLVAGVIAAVGVYAGLGSGGDPARSRYATAVAVFGLAFLGGLVGAVVVADQPVTTALLAAVVVGLVAAAVAYVKQPLRLTRVGQ